MYLASEVMDDVTFSFHVETAGVLSMPVMT